MSNEKTPENQTWVQKVEGTKKAYNDDNNKSLGKSLHDIKPAAATPPNQPAPKPQPQSPSFADRIKQTPKQTPPTPPRGPKK